MTKRALYAVILKVMGIAGFIYIIFNLFSLVITFLATSSPYTEPSMRHSGLPMIILFPILLLILSFILLKWSEQIAQWLVREDSPLATLETRDWEKPVFSLSLRVAGVICFIWGIPGMANDLVRFFYDWGSYNEGFDTWAHFINDIVLIVLGAYLLRGGKHVVRYVFREPKARPIESGPE